MLQEQASSWWFPKEKYLAGKNLSSQTEKLFVSLLLAQTGENISEALENSRERQLHRKDEPAFKKGLSFRASLRVDQTFTVEYILIFSTAFSILAYSGSDPV